MCFKLPSFFIKKQNLKKSQYSKKGAPTAYRRIQNLSKTEESVQPVTSNRSLPSVEQEDQIPAVPKSLPSQMDGTLESCPKFRIVVVGKCGIGKSSLIKRIFNVDPKKIYISHCKTGKADINVEYKSQNSRFILHDSKGFEAGSNGHWTTVKCFLESRQQQDLPGRIHAIWFCVETPLTGSRLLHVGDEGLLKLAKEFDIPIIAVFTKYDLLVTQFWRKDKELGKSSDKRDIDAERKASDSFDRSVKLLQEEWAKLPPECVSKALPCVRISTTDDNAIEMLKVLEDETQKTISQRLY